MTTFSVTCVAILFLCGPTAQGIHEMIPTRWVIGGAMANTLHESLASIPEIRVAIVDSYELPRGPYWFIHPLGPTHPAATGSDPLSWQQYALNATNITPAWAITLGEGTLVAILDSGVDLGHEDLQQVALARSPIPRYDGSTGDGCGHGTRVTGLLVAGFHNGLGISGASPHSVLAPIRVLGNDGGCTGNTFDLAAGIVAAANMGARVISLSLTAGDPNEATPPEVGLALAYAHAKGSIIIAAAGNDARGVSPPANDPNVLSVGCVTESRVICGFSPPNARVLAPGLDILTTDDGGGYATVSGTSFSAPYVAAEAALILSRDPSLSAKSVEALIEQTATSLGATRDGPGEINIGAAVATFPERISHMPNQVSAATIK